MNSEKDKHFIRDSESIMDLVDHLSSGKLIIHIYLFTNISLLTQN